MIIQSSTNPSVQIQPFDDLFLILYTTRIYVMYIMYIMYILIYYIIYIVNRDEVSV